MADTKKKLLILSQIAAELNKQDIIWAVGASLLLYFKGIVQEFADIDILVSESDIEKANKIFLTFGKQMPASPNKQYKTKAFSEFSVDGVDFDVIAGFIVTHDGIDFYMPLERGQTQDRTVINGESIPLQTVDQWRHIYELMGRTDKVDLIDRYKEAN